MTELAGQSTDSLLKALRQAGRAPALDLIRTCLQNQDALREGLLQMLATNPFEAYGISQGESDPRIYAPVHAGYLLTAFHETQALPLIADIFRDEERGYLIEWFIAAVYDYGQPAVEPFAELVEDEEAFAYGRAAATEVLSRIGRLYPELREEVIGHLLAVLPAELEAGDLAQLPTTGEEIWTWALVALADLGADEFLPRVRPLFEKDLVDPDIAGTWEAYQERIASPAQEVRSFNILDTYRYLHVQAQQEAIKRQAEVEERGRQSAEHERVEPGGPTVRAEPKVGRNDPCPCGSGKKYKHCHGRPGR